jgi:hypothetical protein
MPKIAESFKHSLTGALSARLLPPLKRLPPETKEQIFGDVIEWHGKTPPVIAALRGDPTLYQEAFAALYKKGTFKIHLDNMESRASANPSTFKYIEKLEIEYAFNSLSFLLFVP